MGETRTRTGGAMTKKRRPENDAFREWTRGLAFSLTMGKTQVATLVAIHASQGMVGHIGARHKLVRQFVTAMIGLKERGLIQHNPPTQTQPRAFGSIFPLTEAGEHVVALLQCSGIYDEIRDELIASDEAVGIVRRAGRA